MDCPNCKKNQTAVIDTRTRKDGRWRKRKCLICKLVFETIEVGYGKLDSNYTA